MKTVRKNLKLCLFCILSLLTSLASASTLTLSGNMLFSSLDGSAQDSDGLANGVFTVNGDLVLDGTISCNDDAPFPSSAGACPVRIAVSGDLTMEAGSGIFAENRRGGGNGGDIRLDVAGDLTLAGPDGTLPGTVISTGRTNGTFGSGGTLTAEVGGAVDLQAGSTLAASSKSGNAGAISVTGESVRVAGLIASGPSRTLLAPGSAEVLDDGSIGQAGGTILLRAAGSTEPGLRIESEGIVVSQGEGGGGRLVLLEACGIEVRGLVASLSRNNGPSQVALRSGRGILVDGRDLGLAAPAEGRFGQIRADGTQQGAAGYLVDLFASSDVQVLGPDSGSSSRFAVTSVPGELPLRNAGGTITAISLEGSLTATGNAFATGRDVLGGKGGVVDLKARNEVTLDDAVLRSVGGYTVLSNAGIGGQIRARSYQGAVSWTFGRGDVRPTGSLILLPARRGTIELTACTTVETTGSQFPVNGSPVAPFPVETEGVCSTAAPSLPAGEPPLPTCAPANQPPAPSGGPFSVPEGSANGTVVGTVAANDPDAGQSHTFSITAGNTDGAFAIDNAGVITVANSAALDFATNPLFHLTVEVTDDGAPPLSGSTVVTIQVTDIPEAPVAGDEGTPANPYVETVGNTILEVTASPVLSGAKIVFDGNLLANDTDPDGPTAFTVALESATAGAVVTLSNDGTFTYLPPPGFTGVDSFTYRITDPTGLSDTATVYINVEHRVWYVKNDATAGGLGRSTEPFDTLAEAEAASAEGDTIYVFEGDGTTSGQSDGITLKSGQRFLGEAVPLAAPATVNINGVDGPVLRAAIGNHPKIENDNSPDAPGEDNGVSVAATSGDMTGVEIRGLELSGFDNAIDVAATAANNASVEIRGNIVTNAGGDGLLIDASSAAHVTVDVSSNTFTANRGDHLQAVAANSANLNVTISGNILTGGHASPLGQGITVNAATAVPGFSGTVNYMIAGNSINGAILSAIQANLGTSTSGAVMSGTISNNTIGTDGDLQSCSSQGSGIAIDAHGNGTHTALLSGNTIRQCFDRGIAVLASDGSGVLNLTVTGNDVSHSDGTNSREGFFLNAGSANPNIFGVADAQSVCLDLGGAGALANTLTHGPGAAADLRIRQRFSTTVRLPGYAGAATDTTAVVSYLLTRNSATTGSATVSSPPGGGFIGGASCPLP